MSVSPGRYLYKRPGLQKLERRRENPPSPLLTVCILPQRHCIRISLTETSRTYKAGGDCRWGRGHDENCRGHVERSSSLPPQWEIRASSPENRRPSNRNVWADKGSHINPEKAKKGQDLLY